MNNQGECRQRRKADALEGLLARELEQARLETEAHVAAVNILKARIARVEALLRCADTDCHCDHARGFVPAREIRDALDGLGFAQGRRLASTLPDGLQRRRMT